MAKGIVLGLGGAGNIESDYGLTPETITNESIDDLELDQKTWALIASPIVDCMTPKMAESFVDQGASSEQAQCIVSKWDVDAFRDLVASGLQSDAESAVARSAAEEAFNSSTSVAFDECYKLDL